MNLSLNPELQQIIQRRIALGLYPDANAVIGDALRRTEPDDEAYALREFLAPRVAAAKRGEFVTQTYDEIFDDVISGN